MSRKREWFKFDPVRFLSETEGMTNEQVGTYFRLLGQDCCEGSLPNRWEYIAKLAEVNPESESWKGLVEIIKGRYVEVEVEGILRLTNEMLEAQRAETGPIGIVG